MAKGFNQVVLTGEVVATPKVKRLKGYSELKECRFKLRINSGTVSVRHSIWSRHDAATKLYKGRKILISGELEIVGKQYRVWADEIHLQ